MREFELPDVGEGVHEGELIEWLVDEGDAVAEDQPVAKVETDKALVDVPAPVDGTVRELRWSEGDVVPVGEVLLVFDVEGEVDEESLDVEPEPAAEDGAPADAGADSRGVAGSTEASGEQAGGAETGGGAAAAGGSTSAGSGSASGRGSRVFAPPSVRRLARELDTDLANVGGSGPGGRVTEQDVRAAAESADTGATASNGASRGSDGERAESAGEGDRKRMEWKQRSADDSADAGAGQQSSTEAGRQSGAGARSQSAAESADRETTLAAPATRRVARELDVDLDAVPAVEERGGEAFVTEDAVREYAEVQQRAQAADAEATSAESGAATARDAAGAEAAGAASAGDAAGSTPAVEREPYRGVRRTIGDAMAESKFTAPHVTHTDDVDVTRLVETRERLAERAEERGIHLTVTPFVLKAVTAALQEFPMLNSSLDEDAEEIVYRNYYDLGVATATDAGLMVPVVEAVDEKGLLQIASELNELVGKARDRSIAPEELRGSTFTVTNVGAIGGEYATPIVNQPEVAILALGQIRRKPRVVEDEETGGESIEPRSVLPLSLSFDHRVVDGAIAAKFTNAVRERLRDPELLLLK